MAVVRTTLHPYGDSTYGRQTRALTDWDACPSTIGFNSPLNPYKTFKEATLDPILSHQKHSHHDLKFLFNQIKHQYNIMI